MDFFDNDSRFSHVSKDAKFRNLPKERVKVKIDERFRSMFRDKKFQIKCGIDKRGRDVQINRGDDLKRYYDTSENEGKEGVNSDATNVESVSSKKSRRKDSHCESGIDVSMEEKKMLTSAVRKKLKNMSTDYARGEGSMFSESSSDEESSDEEVEEEFVHCWGELDKDAEYTDNITRRLAVCNLDWDRVGAQDLMVLFNSFLPKGGLIHSVTIYPSEFGMQRMKEEDEKGPMELAEDFKTSEWIGNEEKFSRAQVEKIRKYQLNRLKYFYAVVVCNSSETADAIYNECDGLDYECSSSKLDLRFIPDDVTFEQVPKDTCSSLPDLSTYKPKYFVTSALTNGKVDLTWDETDVNRQEAVKSIHNGTIDESCLKKYLACSSSSSSEEEEDKDEGTGGAGKKAKANKKIHKKIPDSVKCEKKEEKLDLEKKLESIQKYKKLLEDVLNKEKNKKNSVDLEVTWDLDLEKKANSLVKEAISESKLKTPFEKYLEKKKNKRKKKKLEKSLECEKNESSNCNNAFSDDEIPSDVDFNDPYFKEELDKFKNTRSKRKKRIKEERENEEIKSKEAEMELLVLDDEPKSKHFNLKEIIKSDKHMGNKKKKKKQRKNETDFNDTFKMNLNDERFSAIYTSSFFNIDPADPQFKQTEGTRQLIEEKLRRRDKEEKESHNSGKE